MNPVVLASIIGSGGGIITGLLVYLSARRANRDNAEEKLRKWADDLLRKVQDLSTEVDRLRDEAHATADELRLVRTEAFRENDMARYRAWLADRPHVIRRAEAK